MNTDTINIIFPEVKVKIPIKVLALTQTSSRKNLTTFIKCDILN